MTDIRACLALVVLIALSSHAATAFACGVSAVDGTWSCSLEEHDEEERPKWNVGASALATWTKLKLGNIRARQDRTAVVATAGYAPTRKVTIALSAGAGIDGELRAPNGVHAMSAGPTGGAGVVYSLIEGRPFLALSGVLSASHARTRLRGEDRSVSYTAFDLRLGVVFGTTLFDVLSPYLVARVFGGPVFWRYAGADTTGTDTSHVQLGAGVTVRPLEMLAIYVEGVPLGERALAGGASFAF